MKRKTDVAAPRVTVRNLQRNVPIDVLDLEKFAARAVELCLRVPGRRTTNLGQLREVSVLIISNRRIALLHRQFMDESGPTDVITFQHGEIFISAEMARRNARRFGNPLKRELCLYVVHGLLHLHGFDDRDQAGAREMQVMQRKILGKAMV